MNIPFEKMMSADNKSNQVDTSKPVLVTGATGYVAGVLVSQLLDHGLTVHATVRDPSNKEKIQHLQDMAARKQKGTLKFFKGDLLKAGSFKEAAKDCSIIFHTASPFTLANVKDPMNSLVEPAVRGTENVLNTANETPTVRRVVLTSSVVAIYGNASDSQDIPGGVFTEENWNRSSTLSDGPYPLSKTLAEQKAWVMAGSQTQWSLVTINPSLVLGPGLKYHDSAQSYQMMVQIGGGAMKSGVPNLPMGVVDVRDVATAEIAAAYNPEAKGRFILNGTNSSLPGVAEVLREKFPSSQYPVATSALGLPKTMVWMIAPYVGFNRKFVWENIGHSLKFDNTRAKEILGIQFRPMNTTVQEMYQQLLDVKAVKQLKA